MKPKFHTGHSLGLIVVGCSLAGLSTQSALAINYTWDGGGGDANWGTAANWNPDGAPTPSSGNSLIFAGTTLLTPINNYGDGDDFQNITFSAGAGAFTISTTGFAGPGTFNNFTGGLTINGGILLLSGVFLNLTHSSTDIVGSLTLGGVLQSNGVYDASNSGGRITGTSAIQVGALGGFALWSSINAGGQASNLDFDNDGVENEVEYFMGQTGSSFTANPGIVNNKVT